MYIQRKRGRAGLALFLQANRGEELGQLPLEFAVQEIVVLDRHISLIGVNGKVNDGHVAGRHLLRSLAPGPLKLLNRKRILAGLQQNKLVVSGNGIAVPGELPSLTILLGLLITVLLIIVLIVVVSTDIPCHDVLPCPFC